ncbi:MAG: outer membrane protein assembly factor BamE [Xanthomonadaceae bacterium]|jgi:outer membrane protein assembly factor BamE|nr:outer membrane protein assembly factor BamE [Xanthomonadaceae bacterium]
MLLRPTLLALALVALTGCGILYKVDVNQGNLVEKDMVESLKPGMTKRQVSLVMGTPSIQTPFDQDRWDYAASISRRGSTPEVKNLTLFFEDNLLVRIEGDYFGQQDETLLDDAVRMRGRAIDPLEEAEQKEREKRRPGGGG